MNRDILSRLQEEQWKLYSRKWNDYEWDGERLYPPVLPLQKVLEGSTARLHVPAPPTNYNVIGTPRSGTMWMHKIVSSLIMSKELNRFRFFLGKFYSPIADRYRVRHYHEGILEDFDSKQKIIFIYRDIRDAIVSGYFYIKNDLHTGTMASTPDNFNKLSFEEGMTKHIILYMKYRMPVLAYWMKVDSPNVVKVRYEDLLIDLERKIRILNNELEIYADDKNLKLIAQKCSWEQMSGRKMGIENVLSHQRKGISGDWQNHFTHKHKAIFRDMGGDELMKELGYQV